jgi:5'-nucleotidase
MTHRTIAEHIIMAIKHLMSGAALALMAACAHSGTVNVKIIGLNDFHGNLQSPGNFRGSAASANVPAGGADVLAAYVAQLKAQNPNNAVVAAGDLIGASPLISALFHDEPTIEAMNRIGLEFNAVGNHEFDEGKTELKRMQSGGCHPTDPNSCKGASVGTPVPFEGAKFKYLAANVFDTTTGATVFPPYGIKTFNGVRVAFIGMTLKATPSIVTPSGVAGLRFDDEAATVNALVPKLRARGVEAIVVLVHQGGFQTLPPSPVDINGCAGDLAGSDIAGIVSQLDNAVDLVISGHTHAAYNCKLPNASGRKIPVTSANAFGRVLSDIDMTVDTTTGDVVSVTATNRVVDRSAAGVSPVPAIKTLVDNYSTLVSPIANQVIGAIASDALNTRNASCAMAGGELIADSQLKATQPASFGGAQIAFMNAGGVRNPGFVYSQISGSEAPGEITYGEAFTVQPFGNSLVTMTLTAQQIKDVLEQQFAGCMGQTATRVMLPSAGFAYTWNGTAPLCSRIVDVKLTTGSSIDQIVTGGVVNNPTKTYRVTVNNFLATGGDGFTVLTGGKDLLGGAQDIDALIDFMAGTKSPNPPYDPNSPLLGKPRIQRTDAGTSCPP